MNADLFIKAVLFLQRYLTACSSEQLRYVRHKCYHKMLDERTDSHEHMIREHMYEFLTLYRAYGNGWFIPELTVGHVINMLIMVDRFYRTASWDLINQASQKLAEIYLNDKEAYDKYAEFFKSYSEYYGDYSRRRCLLNSQSEED